MQCSLVRPYHQYRGACGLYIQCKGVVLYPEDGHSMCSSEMLVGVHLQDYTLSQRRTPL